MKRFSLLAITFLLIQTIFAQKQKDRQAILDVLHLQENGWNKGDLQGFMQGYWKSDSLAFVGSKGVTYGWDNTLRNYEKGYSDTVKMGKLHFDILKIDVMDARHAFIIGAWHLQRSIGDIGGHFTLLFLKVGGKWVIAVDHTS